LRINISLITAASGASAASLAFDSFVRARSLAVLICFCAKKKGKSGYINVRLKADHMRQAPSTARNRLCAPKAVHFDVFA